MAILQRFLGDADREPGKRRTGKPSEFNKDKPSIFFEQEKLVSKEGEIDESELPLYVSSKGYFFH